MAAVLTFRPHPSALFRPEQPTRLINDAPTQALLLARLGVEVIIIQPFVRAFAQIEAEAFLPWLKEKLPHLAGVYVGQNWRFGAKRRGDMPLLQASAQSLGLALFTAPPVSRDGVPINSTRIRMLLEAGDVEAANALLGYRYFAHRRCRAGQAAGADPRISDAQSSVGARPATAFRRVSGSGQRRKIGEAAARGRELWSPPDRRANRRAPSSKPIWLETVSLRCRRHDHCRMAPAYSPGNEVRLPPASPQRDRLEKDVAAAQSA